MKNKFLALAAFGTAVLGGAILSAPASAQIAQGSGPTSTITVNVSVPEILYLRTITTANIAVTPQQLVGTSGASLTSVGGTPPAYIGTGTSATPAVDTTSPFSVGGAPVTLTPIPSAYIVFSNSPTGTYNVAITPGTFTGPNSTALAVGVDATDVSNGTIAAEGLSSATPKSIILNATFSGTAPAGNYAGTLKVEAFRPN